MNFWTKTTFFRNNHKSTLLFLRGRPRPLLRRCALQSCSSAEMVFAFILIQTHFSFFTLNKLFRSCSLKAIFYSTFVSVLTRSTLLSSIVNGVERLFPSPIVLNIWSNFLKNLLSFSRARAGRFFWQFGEKNEWVSRPQSYISKRFPRRVNFKSTHLCLIKQMYKLIHVLINWSRGRSSKPFFFSVIFFSSKWQRVVGREPETSERFRGW